MLTLSIKKKWYDMILSGEKKEEYREIKKYYGTRFATLGVGNHQIHEILFRNGYSKTSPTIKCRCYIDTGYGLPEWGAIPGNVYYVLRILSVEEVKDSE